MSSPSQMPDPQLNATPLIDVLLVLLVMLIFTLPVMTHNVSVNMPVGTLSDERPELIQIDIDFDGALAWNGQPVESITVLENRLRAAHMKVPGPQVRVIPDSRGRYEVAAQVLAAAQRARIRNLSIGNVSDR